MNSDKLNQIYVFIVTYMEEHNYPPTFREIGDGCKLKSTQSVSSYMIKLKEQKLIDYEEGKPRTITVSGITYTRRGKS